MSGVPSVVSRPGLRNVETRVFEREEFRDFPPSDASRVRHIACAGCHGMAAWQPTAEGLQQLLGLFKATQGADNEQHRNIFEQLRSFNAVPDYNCYLAFILNQMRQEETAVRQTAGLVLKNNITQHWASVAPEVQQYVRENLLGCLGDEVPYIRNTVGSCITTITMEEGLKLWPALLPSLYQMLDSPDQHLFEGAFAALHKICEDASSTRTRARARTLTLALALAPALAPAVAVAVALAVALALTRTLPTSSPRTSRRNRSPSSCRSCSPSSATRTCTSARTRWAASTSSCH